MNKVCNNHLKFQNVDEETIANIIDKLSPKIALELKVSQEKQSNTLNTYL